ncbi:unnamed protein product, partial [Gulo gulo]
MMNTDVSKVLPRLQDGTWYFKGGSHWPHIMRSPSACLSSPLPAPRPHSSPLVL